MAFPTLTVTPGTGTTINTLPNAGQALAADSLPVVLTALQEAALKVLAAGSAIIGKVGIDQTTPGTTNLVAAGLVASEAFVGKVGGVIDNPTSTLTRPADTTAYAQNDLIASNTTAGSVVVPSITLARVAAGSFVLRKIRLHSNKTSGWDASQLRVRFWSAAPTYTNGDNGAYAAATGSAGLLGQMDVLMAQYGDGAMGFGVSHVGGELAVKLASGQIVYWDLQLISAAALTPASGQVFTLTAEDYQN